MLPQTQLAIFNESFFPKPGPSFRRAQAPLLVAHPKSWAAKRHAELAESVPSTE